MKLVVPQPSGSFRGQIVVLTACATAFAMLVLTVVLQIILADLSRSTVDRVLSDRADAVVSSAISASTDSGLEVPTADLDAGIVVYDATGAAVAGLAERQLQAAFDDLSTADSVTYRNAHDQSRLIAQPFRTDQGDAGVVVVSERLAPYESAERYALIVSLVTGLIATAAAAAIAAWVTSRALRPVAVLSSTAADWSEHDLSRRFELGPPTNEITALAATLDTLLDKVSAALRSEQRLTSELAHELRTPLTAVQGSADLALMHQDLTLDLREALEEISGSARRMATTITTLLDLARSSTATLAAATCSLAEVVADVLRAAPHDHLTVRVDVADQRVSAPSSIATRALAPLVENAVRFADSTITISSAAAVAGEVRLWVEDDGPGTESPDDGIFAPGTTSSGGSGAGLGLSIARRMARSVGGDVHLVHDAHPTRFELRLPRG